MSIINSTFASHSEDFGGRLFNDRFWSYGGVRSTVSGHHVTPEAALACGAYFACIQAISVDIGRLPMDIYKRKSDGSRILNRDHPSYKLMHDRPNPTMSAQAFRETLTSYALNNGNGIAEIQRDGAGDPVHLWPIHPSRVQFRKQAGGGLIYRVRVDDMKASTSANYVDLKANDVYHIHGLGDGDIGYSIAHLAAESVGLSFAQQEFASGFFGNGAAFSGVLEHPGQIGEEGLQNLRRSWNDMYSGATKSNGTLILEEGMSFKAMSVPPDAAQFLESRQFQIEEICRWFRVPPLKIGHNQNTPYSNVESLNEVYLQDALDCWLSRWENEHSAKLVLEKERGKIIADHDTTPLLGTDAKTRYENHRIAINNGIMTVNEVRTKENLPPVDGGSKLLIGQSMTTLDVVSEGENMASNNPVPKKDPGGDRDEAEPNDSSAAVRPVVLDAMTRMSRKESNARDRANDKFKDDDAGLAEWAMSFYKKHCEHMHESLEAAASVAVCLGLSCDWKAAVDDYCAQAFAQGRVIPADALTDYLMQKVK